MNRPIRDQSMVGLCENACPTRQDQATTFYVRSSRDRGNHGAPVDAFGVRPKSLKIVKFASFRQKRMQHDVAPVLQDPRTLFVSFRCGRLVSAGFHLNSDFIAQGMHLTDAGPGGDYEKIHDRSNSGQIEYHCVLTAILFAQFGNVAGIFQAALQTVLRGGGGDGGGNSKTPRNKSKNLRGSFSISRTRQSTVVRGSPSSIQGRTRTNVDDRAEYSGRVPTRIARMIVQHWTRLPSNDIGFISQSGSLIDPCGL